MVHRWNQTNRKQYMIGVYQIKNKLNEKVYIGSSVNVENRWYQHKKFLRDNSHCNEYLQNSWNTHKEESFEFTILEVLEEEKELFIKEQYWIDICSSFIRDKGYNIQQYAGSGNRGICFTQQHKDKIRDSRIGKKHSIETKNKIGKISKNRFPTEDTRKKLSSCKKGEYNKDVKLNWDLIKEIRKNYEGKADNTYISLARKYNVAFSTIQRIINNTRWVDENYNPPNKKWSRKTFKTKLTRDTVEKIREEYKKNNISQKELSSKYNVSISIISDIVNNRTWVKKE
jgi:group I intron endonuclease